jgi:hypothetical protein
MTVRSADPGAGDIRLHTSMSLVTWGDLDIRLRPVAADAVEVAVHSSLKFGLVDWGKNQENIGKLFHHLGGFLAPCPGAWLPDPSTRHELPGGMAAGDFTDG